MPQSHKHPEAVALYRAVLAHPDEDTPRLVYADWLDEHGDDADRAHAELIRTECRRRHMNVWDDGYTAERARDWRLLREVGDRWCRAPGESERADGYPSKLLTASRGFAGGVKFFLQDVTPEQARDWFTCRPITWAEHHVGLSEGQNPLWQLTTDTLPSLRGVRLELSQFCPPNLRPVIFRTLAGAKNRSGLIRMEINCALSLADLEVVVTSPYLRNLEAFSLSGREVVDAHAVVLAKKARLPALRELAITINDPEEEERRRRPRASPSAGSVPRGLRALGGAKWFAKLHTFQLTGHDNLTEAGLEALLGTQPLPELRKLQISASETAEATGHLIGGSGLSGLRELILTGSSLLTPIWLQLTAGPQEFLSLNVGKVWLNEDSKGVFNRPTLRNLRRLVVSDGDLAPSTVEELARSPLTQTLRSLSFPGSFRVDTTAPLLTGRDWPHLEYLFINNHSPWKSLIALIESDKFPRLVGLKARCSEGTAVFIKRLAKCPAAAKFRELELGGDMTPAAVGALANSPHLDGIDRLVLSTRGNAKPEDREPLEKRLGKRVAFEFDNVGR